MHYDVIYHPFPINSQYLKTWGVDSPDCSETHPLDNLCLIVMRQAMVTQYNI